MGKNSCEFSLGPDERDRLEGILEEGVDAKDKRRFVVSRLNELRSDEADGDESAARIVETMAVVGLMKTLNQQIGKEKSVLIDPSTKRVVDIPKRANIRVRADDGAFTGATQSSYWVSLSIPDFIAWANGQLHLTDAMNIKSRFIRLILKAITNFPQAKTPGEACRLAGIDPDSIELDLAV